MRRELVIAAALLLFAACSNNTSVPSPQPSNAAGPCGTESPNVVYLSSSDVANPSSAAARNAVAAYAHHSAIVLCGSELAQLASLLKLGDAGTASAIEEVIQSTFKERIKHRGQRHKGPPGSPPPVPTPEPPTDVPIEAVGFHLSHNGVVQSYDSFDEDANDEKARLDDWTSEITTHADEPPIGSWQPVYTNTETYTDNRGDTAQITFGYYRLNNFNTSYDWYMETERELGTPKWKGCQFSPFIVGHVGYFNTDRSVEMSPEGSGVVLYEHAPKTTESTKTTSFAIGKSLDKLAGGVTAEYSQSWSMPDVKIRDLTSVPKSRQEIIFTPPDLQAVIGEFGCPPETSKTTFVTPHASIFQVPQGGSVKVYSPAHVSFMLWDPIRFLAVPPRYEVQRTSGRVNFGPTYSFRPSVFQIPDKKIELSSGHRKATIHITARNGDSNLGWNITNHPYWVVLSQTHGLGNKDVTIEVQADTPNGSIANLNFDTDPRGGANNVEAGPLILRVEYHT